jgi:hypothetical protein
VYNNRDNNRDGDRSAKYDRCIIKSHGRVIKKYDFLIIECFADHIIKRWRRTVIILECKTKHEIYLYPRLHKLYVYTLTLPRNRSGSVVNNMNDVDGHTGDIPDCRGN